MTSSRASMWSASYDILIVGAGIVGASLAHALSSAVCKNFSRMDC